ncbi:Single-stranded DNA-binding protein [Candidatus Xenohaliotis californiensis]|uniref:Single-stranded DNA-binding protein n=1 Tax=Candidatus Xenohaliotis californiensis TaxID=84677 RepID=A0ABP0ERW7_9RICK|nr:Single-stranded DNA-binding protein [Candidatus Xenohaliotis californiensis]
MASGINKAILIGNTGKDPVVRSTASGAKVASFPLATSESWIDKTTNKRREKTEWHNIVIYGDGLVSITEKFVKKGTKLYIEGTIQTRRWVDAENNQRTTTEIVLQGFNCTLSILDKKQSLLSDDPGYHASLEMDGVEQISAENTNNLDAVTEDDDIPF